MQAARQTLCLVPSGPDPVLFLARRAVRLNRDTLAIANREGKNIAVSVPEGAYVKVVDLAAGSRLVDVEWAGEIVQMFAVDIRDRGELAAVAS